MSLSVHIFYCISAISATSITLLALPGDFTHYLNIIKDLHIADYALGPAFIIAAKYVLAFPVSYHYINGMRHLVSTIFDISVLSLMPSHQTGLGGLIGCAKDEEEIVALFPTVSGNILSWILIMKYFLRSFSPFH